MVRVSNEKKIRVRVRVRVRVSNEKKIKKSSISSF